MEAAEAMEATASAEQGIAVGVAEELLSPSLPVGRSPTRMVEFRSEWIRNTLGGAHFWGIGGQRGYRDGVAALGFWRS